MYNFMSIGKEVSIESPAKINLHLEVGEKREDGYHSITSLFQTITLFDIITIRRIEEADRCTIRGLDAIPLKENLMYRAYNKFRTRIHTSVANMPGVAIRIEKRIPSAAGLGGGSSNAAAVLHGLNILCGTNFSNTELARMGTDIGSDVPFFCHTSPLALVRGKGEKIEPIDSPRILRGILISPEQEIKTEEAYGWIDSQRQRESATVRITTDDIVKDYTTKTPDAWRCHNSFTTVICDRYPEIKAIFRKIYVLGASYVSVTGSGSALYGLFDSEAKRIDAFEQLKSKDYRVWKIKTLDRIPSAIVK
jgi:4-diphosphocytidyl-2-C-methyl-D-erythritol kinase